MCGFSPFKVVFNVSQCKNDLNRKKKSVEERCWSFKLNIPSEEIRN